MCRQRTCNRGRKVSASRPPLSAHHPTVRLSFRFTPTPTPTINLWTIFSSTAVGYILIPRHPIQQWLHSNFPSYILYPNRLRASLFITSQIFHLLHGWPIIWVRGGIRSLHWGTGDIDNVLRAIVNPFWSGCLSCRWLQQHHPSLRERDQRRRP